MRWMAGVLARVLLSAHDFLVQASYNLHHALNLCQDVHLVHPKVLEQLASNNLPSFAMRSTHSTKLLNSLQFELSSLVVVQVHCPHSQSIAD